MAKLKFAFDHAGAIVSRAKVHALLGDEERALRLIDEGLRTHYPGWTLHREPGLRPLWQNRRFRQLVHGDAS